MDDDGRKQYVVDLITAMQTHTKKNKAVCVDFAKKIESTIFGKHKKSKAEYIKAYNTAMAKVTKSGGKKADASSSSSSSSAAAAAAAPPILTPAQKKVARVAAVQAATQCAREAIGTILRLTAVPEGGLLSPSLAPPEQLRRSLLQLGACVSPLYWTAPVAVSRGSGGAAASGRSNRSRSNSIAGEGNSSKRQRSNGGLGIRTDSTGSTGNTGSDSASVDAVLVPILCGDAGLVTQLRLLLQSGLVGVTAASHSAALLAGAVLDKGQVPFNVTAWTPLAGP